MSRWTNLNMSLAPRLQISRVGNGTLTLRWWSPVPGWTAESKTDLTGETWQQVGTTNPIIIVPGWGTGFFRLRK
jgi:hypothetical protein